MKAIIQRLWGKRWVRRSVFDSVCDSLEKAKYDHTQQVISLEAELRKRESVQDQLLDLRKELKSSQMIREDNFKSSRQLGCMQRYLQEHPNAKGGEMLRIFSDPEANKQ